MSEVESKKTANLRVGKRRLKRFAFISLLGIVVLLVAGELIARFGLGLGTPPLSIAHPTIEYMFKPNQDVRRFDNRVKINAYGMRSDDFPKEKQDPNELRIMVLGDSVINGGNLTDQSEICTEILKRKLEAEQDRPVVVGNISAVSWGPPNFLAYIEEYGTFDADLAIIVLSSHDLTDVPTFEPLNPNANPTKSPSLALFEGYQRYFLPMAKRWLAGERPPDQSYQEIELDTKRGEECLVAFEALLNRFAEVQVPVLVLLHFEREELELDAIPKGIEILAQAAERGGAKVVLMKDAFGYAIADQKRVYRDRIHPTSMGQQVIVDSAFDWVLVDFSS